MSPTATLAPPPEVVYPDYDGEPMADNTLQFDWIVLLKANLDAVFRDAADVFVAGNNLIYAVEGQPAVRAAPDVYVTFGRPKGYRGSYQVWREGNVFPQVVIEVLSTGNRAGEMDRKMEFYRTHGAEEYYVVDPDRGTVAAYRRAADGLFEAAPAGDAVVSPRLGVRFERTADGLVVSDPAGRPFRTLAELADVNAGLVDVNAKLVDVNAALAAQAAAERARADRLRAALMSAGLDPDAV